MNIVNLSSPGKREVLVRASDLETVLRWVCSLRADAVNEALREGAQCQIEQARRLARRHSPLRRMISGVDIQSANRYLDAAYVNILRLAPPEYLDGLLANLLMDAQLHLPPGDPRLEHLRNIQARAARDKTSPELQERDRYVVVATLQASQKAANLEVGRVRNLRTVIIGVAAVTMLLAIGIGFFGVWKPGAVPMCFAPDDQTLIVCPFTDRTATVQEGRPIAAELRSAASRLDAFLVLGVGLVGATISAAAGLRKMNASHDPYSLQVTLAVAKLPIGAVTAFLGILMLRAEFVPGLSALDSSAQIIGWSIILGYAQQLFTGLVDRQAADLLAQAASAPEATRRPATAMLARPAT